jgi:hypothetical protein
MLFWGVWVKQGVLGTSRGCCEASESIPVRSCAADHVPGGAKAGDTAVIDAHIVDDMAVHVDTWGIGVGL